MGANEVMKIIAYTAAALTSVLAACTFLISLRFRKEILFAEKRRARAILHPHHAKKAEDRPTDEHESMLLAHR